MKIRSVTYLSAVSLNERIRYIKLLFRWHGSVWQLLWANFLCFITLYIGIALLYRLYLINDPEHKRIFEATVAYLNRAAELVPLSFLLGFFVLTVLERWWTVVDLIPWLTNAAFTCQGLITGKQPITQMNIRLTVTRYMNLAWILSIYNISHKIRNRFSVPPPGGKKCCGDSKNLQLHIPIRKKMEKINSDLMIQKTFGKIISEEEILVFEDFEKTSHKPSYLIPLMWATKLLERSLKAGHLKSEIAYRDLFKMIRTFEANLGNLQVFNEFNMPLVYTQVIIIVVYTFQLSEIFSQQIITSTFNNVAEVYFPVFGIFKFLIYMGWFKVGLCFLNPFGDEDIDLPLGEILDYNLEVSSSIAPCKDHYFPEYLSDSFDDAKKDRFGILNKFCAMAKMNQGQYNENGQTIGDVIMMSTIDGSD